MKQSTIVCCSKTLFVGAILAFIFCILMAVFTAQIGSNDTFNILFSTAFAQAKKLAGGEIPKEIEDQKPIVLLGAIMIILTVIGIIMACCTKVTMHCICVTITMIVLFILSMILMVFGAILVGPRIGGIDYIRNNCEYASNGQLDKVDMYSRQLFEPIVDFDRQFQEGVNKQMCSNFCVCPGGPTDTHYQEYSKVPASVYKKFKRSFLISTDKDVEQLRWNYMPSQGIPYTDKSPTSASMLECYDNAQKIAVKMAELSGNKEEAEKKRKEVEAAKPDPTFVKIVSHIEEKYKCSGLCQKPLFYFTQSVKMGPPKTPCLEPLIDDISMLLQNLGGVLLITGILFFFMFFCSLPICYYDKEKEATEMDEIESKKKDVERSEAYK